MNRLNFGCGSVQPAGWINLDSDPAFGATCSSLCQLDDESFDIVVAHCALQVNAHDDLAGVLADIYRVLKPGGIFRASLPDIARGFEAYLDGDIDWFPNSEADIDDRFSNWLTWYSTTRTLLTPDALKARLAETGFMTSTRFAFGIGPASELDDREGECYFVEAVK